MDPSTSTQTPDCTTTTSASSPPPGDGAEIFTTPNASPPSSPYLSSSAPQKDEDGVTTATTASPPSSPHLQSSAIAQITDDVSTTSSTSPPASPYLCSSAPAQAKDGASTTPTPSSPSSPSLPSSSVAQAGDVISTTTPTASPPTSPYLHSSPSTQANDVVTITPTSSPPCSAYLSGSASSASNDTSQLPVGVGSLNSNGFGVKAGPPIAVGPLDANGCDIVSTTQASTIPNLRKSGVGGSGTKDSPLDLSDECVAGTPGKARALSASVSINDLNTPAAVVPRLASSEPDNATPVGDGTKESPVDLSDDSVAATPDKTHVMPPPSSSSPDGSPSPIQEQNIAHTTAAKDLFSPASTLCDSPATSDGCPSPASTHSDFFPTESSTSKKRKGKGKEKENNNGKRVKFDDTRVPSLEHPASGVDREVGRPGAEFLKSSDMVTVVVGEKLIPFGIHKNVLVAYSPVMSAGLQSVVAGQPPNVVMLRNVNPEIFSYLPFWMYEGCFPMIDVFVQSRPDTRFDPFSTLIEVYALATQLEMHIVTVDVLYTLEWIQEVTKTLPSLRNMNRAWEITRGQPNHALRYMFGDWYVYFVRNPGLLPQLREVLNKEVAVDLLCRYAQYATGCDCQESRIPRNWETYAMTGGDLAADEPYYPGVKGSFPDMPAFVRK